MSRFDSDNSGADLGAERLVGFNTALVYGHQVLAVSNDAWLERAFVNESCAQRNDQSWREGANESTDIDGLVGDKSSNALK